MMAVWTDITTGFDTEEETVNFGTWTISDDNKALFENFTLATIRPQGEVGKNPCVTAASFLSGRVCVAVDSSLIVFTDETCSEVQFTYTFKSSIDCFTVSDDGLFIIVGVKSVVHCFYCYAKGQILFSRSALLPVNHDLVFIKIFIHAIGNKICDLLIVGNSGQIFRIPQLKFEALLQAIQDENEAIIKQVTDVIQVETIREECCKSLVSSAALLTDNESTRLVLVGNEITMWSAGSSVSESWMLEEPVSRIKAIKAVEHASLLISLTEDGKLLVMCSQTLLSLSLYDEIPIQDFILLEDVSAEKETGVLLLTYPDECGKCYIQLASFPGLKQKFQFCVSPATFLVSSMSTTQELLFLEEFGSQNSEFVLSLHIRNISESCPEDRYHRLLRRRKFDDAEAFACRFNLDVELVYKERVKHCMELLQSWSSPYDPSKEMVNFNEFVSLLNKIQDQEFVCEACMKAITVDLTKLQALLDYASDRLKKGDVRNLNTGRLSSLESQLWSTSLRLDTFLLVYQPDLENLKWCEFSRADLMNVCKQHLQRGQLSQASLIWARHWNSFKAALSETNVIDLLGAIPTGMNVPKLISWLYHFIPSVLHAAPQSMQHVVNWAITSIKYLEVEKANWPQSGLEFAEQLLQTIKLQPDYHQVLSHQQQSVISTYCEELVLIIGTLTELKQLKENHKIHVALADFMQNNKSEVVSVLLGKVAPVDIKLLMKDFLSMFMLDNGLVPDTVLSECIDGILSHSASWWYYYAEAPWEETVAAIISWIHNIEVRIKCIISVLKLAPVPWSSTVAGIAKQGLDVDHPLIELIRHEQKMMEVKIVQKKYGFTKLLVENCNLYDLIRQIRLIFRQGDESMLKDALKFSMLSTKLLEETYVLCIEHYLETGRQQKALEVLRNLKAELIIKCCQRIVFKAQSYLQSHCHHKVRTSYMEVLSSLGSRLEKAASIVGDKFLSDIPLQEVRNINLLQLEFGKKVTLKDYSCIQSRCKILSECVENLLGMLGTTDDSFGIYCKVIHLTSLLQLPPEEGVLKMIHQAIQTENVLLACTVMRNLLHYDSFPKSTNQNLLAMVFQFLHASFTASRIGAALQITYSIASKACTGCSLDALSSWLELLYWIRTAQYLTVSYEDDIDFKVVKSQTQDIMTRWHFTPLYKDPAIFSNGNEVMVFLNELFFCRLYPNVPGQLDNSRITIKLKGLARQLQEQQCDLGAVRLWRSLNSWNLSMPDDSQLSSLLLDTEHVFYHSVHVLLSKVITARRLDIELGLALLFVLGTDAANQWLHRSLENFKQDFQKLDSVAQLGVLFCNHCKLDSKIFLSVHTRCTWAKRLSKYGIPYAETLTLTTSQNMQMLQSVMKLKHVNISLILDYCSDFELDLQECLLLHLKSILLVWEPEFEVEKTVNGEEVLNVQNTETEVTRKCKDIIELIENKEDLVRHLTLTLDNLNYYNYEMYICIINLLEQLLPSHNFISKKALLLFLREYRRVQGPKPEELDEWLRHFPRSLTLPVISQWRLPFLQIMGRKTLLILTPELNLKTYKQWIELSAVLGIDTNNICAITVQETMKVRASLCLQTSNKWSIYSQDVLLLDQLEECVNNISNLEMASACMYFIMNHTSPGADQVAAAKLCYAHTQKWAQHDGSTNAKTYLNKVIFKYLCLATTHILHQYGLDKSSYLQLVPKPLELMSALYQDPSIVARNQGHIAHFPDINGAVEELASLHEENYIKFCLNQLSKWLQPKDGLQPGLLEDTCDLTRLLQNPKQVSDNGDNLLRACYMLKCREGSSLINYLVKLAFQLGPGEECVVAVQVRALQCLMATSSTDTLEELTGRNIDDIRQMLKNLKYASELEMLGYSYSLSGFESCNKLELVKGIWRSQSNNPQALIVIARLCVEFDIQQHDIWALVLEQMTKDALVHELEVLVLHLVDVSHIVNSSEYLGAWESVLFTPFLKGEQEDVCIHSLILLQSCPVLRRINLNVIIEHSLELRRPHLAAVLLPFLKEEEFHHQKQKIVRDSTELIKNLQDLTSKGVLIAEKAIELLQPSEEIIIVNGINH